MSQRNFQLGSQSVNSCSDVSVTVNNGHGPAGYVPGSAVTVQPVLTQQPVPRQQPITKVLLKAVNKKKNAGAKNVHLEKCKQLFGKHLLSDEGVRDQLCSDVTEGNFDIGYLQSNTVFSIRSKEDLAEIWSSLRCYTMV